jgi:UDP-glucose 4-epimerase
MPKVLITGASGFVGNNLARFLVKQNHEVHLLLREECANWRLQDMGDDVRVHRVDLRDRDGVHRTLKALKPRWVFHLAAHGAYSFQTDDETILMTNVMGTVNLIRAALDAGVEVFVNTGSSSEYGFKNHPPREDEPIQPNSHYAVAKAAGTLFCGYTARATGTRIPTLRLYSVYGPYEDPTRLMPTIILKGMEDRLPPLVNPEVSRDFVYVDDVVRAYLLAATAGNQEPDAVYNVGTGKQTSIRTVVDTARQVLEISEEPQWASMPDRIWDTDTWVCDNSLISEKLDWRPEVSLSEGFARMVDWFKAHPNLTELYRSMRDQGTRSA